mmetsp:Transcript_25573/g.39262  ORF Transcript_25573/g.39262 Transcript_25573/m.39262 type:complete len:453 (+) Transcript_25573:1-1359(+)
MADWQQIAPAAPDEAGAVVAGSGDEAPESVPLGHRAPRSRYVRTAAAVGTGLLGVALVAVAVVPHASYGPAGASGLAMGGSIVGLNAKTSAPKCQEAKRGTQCYRDMLYAQAHIKAHPDWYIGLNKEDNDKAFQAFLHKQKTKGGHRRCPMPCGHIEKKDAGHKALAFGKCHDSVKGEECFNHVTYTKKQALPKHPEWYTGLPADSSFKVIQNYLFKQHVCPKPCHLEDEVKKVVVGPGHCHTAVAGDPCYGDVLFAMANVKMREEWYDPLTVNSTFEEFQAYLHKQAKGDITKLCPLPCDKKAVKALEDIDVSSCHTAFEGESCYKSVAWVHEVGIHKNPGKYKNITKYSSFEEIQHRLWKDSDVHCKRKPCLCTTAQKPDKCWKAVTWVMSDGVKKHPKWYKGLTNTSTFEEVQNFLHEKRHPKCKKACRRAPWLDKKKGPAAAGAPVSV